MRVKLVSVLKNLSKLKSISYVAAESIGIGYTISLGATCTMEDIAEAAPNGLRFQQLYIIKDRNTTAKHIERAEKAGCKALVITVDGSIPAYRRSDLRNEFSFPPHVRYLYFKKI